MRVYELMIIYNGDLDEEAVAAWQTQVTTNIEAEGGRIPTVFDTEPWGRRRFAYQIDHKWEGFYVVLEVVTEANDLDSTDRILRLADRSDVVRHKIMRLPDDEATRRGLIGEAEPADVG
ncbi:MAG TPA: 30S ribosomal protein S6 [Acidimicrobiales bacterium]|jgi:small subunit ribosomal protein S6|nr:30S ribosomal protein S6 [Actinomycetota bacterium]MBP91493.1 30S ribosomal protein S6 [Acidimicrobiaceae bacterium]MDP6177287.1 30S ribosomal protein S6 [Acidimicrobiales bacterium]MDP6281127.1 30S ribosomal protein S6 [Acidimicrobiales bacterium]MDP7116886.1 30S ribosomal protein S6 [Acidimicrobiales bacterium]